MKKCILLALSVALCATAFAACEQPEVHTHTWSDWKSDVNAHWKETTCEEAAHADVYKKEFAVHNDADKDGDCDDCGYVLCTHVNNDAGICTLCGYGTPDVSDVAKAIAVAKVQNSVVKYGELVDFNESKQTYAFKDGYTYVNDADINYEYYFSLDAAGEPFGVSVTTYAGEYEMIKSESAYANVQKDHLYGAKLSLDYLDLEDVVFCGAFGIVNNLYDFAKEDLNKDFTTSVEDGVYSFSFGTYSDAWEPCFYVTTVSFKLDETNYFISEVTVNAKAYTGEAIVATPQEDESVLYSVAENAETTQEATATAKQFAEEKADVNPYKPADLTVTSYKLVDANFEEVTALNIEKGYDTVLYVTETLPETASMDYAVVEFSGDNVNGDEWETSLSVNYFDGEITLSTPADVGSTFALKVSVNGVEKTINVTVVAPAPTTIVVGQVVPGDYYAEFSEAEEDIKIFAGESYLLGAVLDKTDGYTVTVKDKDNQDVTITAEDDTYPVYNEETYATSYLTVYDLSALAAGEYTFTFTATEDTTVTTSVTVIVKAAPTMASIFNGSYTYDILVEENEMLGEAWYDRVKFTFANWDDNFGNAQVTITKVAVVDAGWWGVTVDPYGDGEETLFMGYAAIDYDGSIRLESRFGEPYTTYALKLNDSYGLDIGIVNVEYDEMEKEEVTAADAIVGEWNCQVGDPIPFGNFTCYNTYVLTFEEDTVTIEYGEYVPDFSMWKDQSANKTYTCAYEIAETAEAGVYAITFSALPGAGDCAVTGFALTNACSIVDVTFDSVSLVIDGTAQTFTK